MDQFHVTPVDPPKKKVSKKTIILIVAGIVLLLGSLAAAGYFAFQNSIATSHVAQLNADKDSLNKQIAQLKSDAATATTDTEAQQDAPKNANDMTRVFSRIQQDPVELTSEDEATILEVVKKHYKVDVLPQGTAILLGYEMVKPDSAPSGEKRALIYWPATGSTPAQFADVIKNAGTDVWYFDNSY